MDQLEKEVRLRRLRFRVFMGPAIEKAVDRLDTMKREKGRASAYCLYRSDRYLMARKTAEKVVETWARGDLRFLTKRTDETEEDTGTTIRQPATPLQQELYDRCQMRTAEYPEGEHNTWMKDDKLGEGYTINQLPNEERPASPDDEKMLGYLPVGWRKCTTTRTCWFCGYTTKPKSTEWPIDSNVKIFGGSTIPC